MPSSPSRMPSGSGTKQLAAALPPPVSQSYEIAQEQSAGSSDNLPMDANHNDDFSSDNNMPLISGRQSRSPAEAAREPEAEPKGAIEDSAARQVPSAATPSSIPTTIAANFPTTFVPTLPSAVVDWEGASSDEDDDDFGDANAGYSDEEGDERADDLPMSTYLHDWIAVGGNSPGLYQVSPLFRQAVEKSVVLLRFGVSSGMPTLSALLDAEPRDFALADFYVRRLVDWQMFEAKTFEDFYALTTPAKDAAQSDGEGTYLIVTKVEGEGEAGMQTGLYVGVTKNFKQRKTAHDKQFQIGAGPVRRRVSKTLYRRGTLEHQSFALTSCGPSSVNKDKAKFLKATWRLAAHGKRWPIHKSFLLRATRALDENLGALLLNSVFDGHAWLEGGAPLLARSSRTIGLNFIIPGERGN